MASVRTAQGSSGSTASKSLIAIVDISGPHSSALIHAVPWFGYSPSRIQPPIPCSRSAKSKYQLSFHSGSSVATCGPSSSAAGWGIPASWGPTRLRGKAARRQDFRGVGQDGQRIGVEHVLAVPLQHHHEHLVAAVGSFDEHR